MTSVKLGSVLAGFFLPSLVIPMSDCAEMGRGRRWLSAFVYMWESGKVRDRMENKWKVFFFILFISWVQNGVEMHLIYLDD